MSGDEDKTRAQPPGVISGLWKNRYQIGRELARGGFGVVYLAQDQELLSKPVVVKVLLDSVDPDPYIQRKFRQEIEALARIDHPGIVGVLDVGETPEGKPFLVMQYVEGATLRSQIRSGGLPLSEVGSMMRQIGHALTAAHEKGVLHRDLKPENIMLQLLGGGDVQVKLIDFGIAAVKDSLADTSPMTSKVAGTVAYMAPEHVMGHASPESDVYALGTIAFEMLTGARPENSPRGVLRRPRDLRPELSAAAESILLCALSYRPEERPARARDFADQLAEALGETNPAAAVSPDLPTRMQTPAAGLESASTVVATGVPRSRPRWGLVVAAGLAAVLVVGAWFYYGRGAGPQSLPSNPSNVSPSAAVPTPPVPQPEKPKSAPAVISVSPPVITPAATAPLPVVVEEPSDAAAPANDRGRAGRGAGQGRGRAAGGARNTSAVRGRSAAQEQRQRLNRLQSRVNALSRNDLPLARRQEFAPLRTAALQTLAGASSAIDRGEVETARENLDRLEQQLDRLENALPR